MKENEIIEGNRLIAEFMGAKDGNPVGEKKTVINVPDFWSKSSTSTHYVSELRYHERWDWLMPVVRKIADLLLNKEWENLQIALRKWKPLCNELEKVNIENTWFCTVQLIKWYNIENKRSGK